MPNNGAYCSHDNESASSNPPVKPSRYFHPAGVIGKFAWSMAAKLELTRGAVEAKSRSWIIPANPRVGDRRGQQIATGPRSSSMTTAGLPRSRDWHGASVEFPPRADRKSPKSEGVCRSRGTIDRRRPPSDASPGAGASQCEPRRIEHRRTSGSSMAGEVFNLGINLASTRSRGDALLHSPVEGSV